MLLRLTCLLFFVFLCPTETWARRRRSHCQEPALEKREEVANMVFTGTVEKIYRTRSEVYRGKIRVKRVLKGNIALVDNTVMVDGFGDPNICYSDVRERDTRIFMVREVSKNNLRLNSSVVRVNVANLDRAASAIRGLPLKRRKVVQETQCEKMYCAYGAQCLIDQRTQLAHCRCQETCHSDVFAPVCGSDGVTYSSECQLRLASCTRKKRIFTRHQGPCGLNDPCEDKECFFGAKCQISLDGRSAECICPEKCATFGGNRNSRPVCGTDGRDYPNVCELRRTSCIDMRAIDIRYKGKCDPCEDVVCPPHQICQLDENRNPECKCNDVCVPEYVPVCGSDGKTYASECVLRVEACKMQKNLRVIYSGDCSTGVNPCNLIKCGPGQECDVDRYGAASCQCPKVCEPKMQPVCGTTGRTFDNTCEMKRQSCLLRQEIAVLHDGECGERSFCHYHHCSFGAVCVVKNGLPVCECPTCSEEFEPVCGSDGISYTNVCKLKREACEKKTNISVEHEGLCNGCDSLQCDFYAVCESDSDGKSVCVCPKVCVKVDAPVCGTDGLSYPNECELRVEACRKQEYVAVATKGFCDQCLDVHCKYGARCENGRCVCPTHCPTTFEHVCSSDGKTYQNECEMRRAACQRSEDLSVQFFGICEAALDIDDYSQSKEEAAATCREKECKYGGVCDYDRDGIPHCICNFPCPAIREPVCGTDGKVYSNECRMREESCRQQRRIASAPQEFCSSKFDVPCDGDPPVIDPSTKKEYYCGKDGGKLCPPKTYCHMTEHFAKCCKETPLIKSCEDTPFGCCPDGRTPVQGPNLGGCPSVCSCNRLGSYSSTCDPVTKQCPCKPGVGGLRCDRCEPGYWGLHKIAKGNSGCISCRCNPYGSVRDDCDQMTGRCICKHGVNGMKCNHCPPGSLLGPDGCLDVSSTNMTSSSCEDMQCYHGAVCKVIGNKSQCVCDFMCPPEGAKDPVCGTDGHSYGSECQLRTFSCRYQRPISVMFFGTCKSRSLEPQNEYSTTTTRVPNRLTRRRSQMRRAESKVTREVTSSYPENLYMSNKKTLTAAVPVTVPSAYSGAQAVEIPMFTGYSYMELYKIDSYTRLSVEIEFKTYSENGILLYNGQSPSGSGDFVSLSIKDGFVEFRYNLGSGTVILRSSQKIVMGKFVKISAKRYMKDGLLSVEGQENVSGRSHGLLNYLDLGENLFVGYVPTYSKVVFSNIGVNKGLTGCIRRLAIDRREVNLRYPASKDIYKGVKIRECTENACSSMPCKNGGTCVISDKFAYKCTCTNGYTGHSCESDADACSSSPCGKDGNCFPSSNGGYICKCPPGKSGKLCNKQKINAKFYVPDFTNNTYLEMPTLQNVKQAFSLEIWFLARSPNGVLLYNGQLLNGKGDFVAVNLVNGHVNFLYNLGSGVANITSTRNVTLGDWHRVKIIRLRKQGILKLDNDTNDTGESKPPLTELNLSLPLYLGGIPNIKYVHRDSGVTKGLDGAIQRIIVNGESWGNLMSRAMRSYGVQKYRGPPCSAGACMHGGICIPELNGFQCKCSLRYRGKQCEKRIRKKDLQRAVSFNGTTYLNFQYKNEKGSRSRKTNKMQFRLRTSHSSGLLLWGNKGSSLRGDYIAVAIVDGYPELSYNLGKQKAFWSIRSPQKVDDGLYHSITVLRKKRFGEIRVDRGVTVSNVSEVGATDLNIDGSLWIGGSPSLPNGLPSGYYQGFSGCVDSIMVDKRPFHFLLQGTEELNFCSSTKMRY